VYIDCFKCVAVAVLCKFSGYLIAESQKTMFSGYLIAESQKTMEMVVEGKNRVAPQKYSFTTTFLLQLFGTLKGGCVVIIYSR